MRMTRMMRMMMMKRMRMRRRKKRRKNKRNLHPAVGARAPASSPRNCPTCGNQPALARPRDRLIAKSWLGLELLVCQWAFCTSCLEATLFIAQKHLNRKSSSIMETPYQKK
jgi:hypothetical protein